MIQSVIDQITRHYGPFIVQRNDGSVFLLTFTTSGDSALISVNPDNLSEWCMDYLSPSEVTEYMSN